MRRRGCRSPWPPRRPRSVPLAVQLHMLLRLYPGSTGTLKAGRLLWRGELTPSEESGTYAVLIDHRLGESPHVHVLSPRLEGPGPIPHTYSDTRLCLFVPGAWADNRTISRTIVPWTMEWLFFYELWSACGEWHGGGIPPEAHPARGRPGSRRRALAQLKHGRRVARDRRRLLAGNRLVHRGRTAPPLRNVPGTTHQDELGTGQTGP